MKKRKIRSLDEINHSDGGSIHHISSNSTPLSPVNLPPFWSNAPSVLFTSDIQQQQQLASQNHHQPSASCPVKNNNTTTAASSKSDDNGCNTSLDSSSMMSFLNPDELAAKGATLLHHLALYMIQEEKEKRQKEIDDAVFKPPVPPKCKTTGPPLPPHPPHPHQGFKTREIRRSEIDRPDSGFDSSKDDGSSRGGEVVEESSSSPRSDRNDATSAHSTTDISKTENFTLMRNIYYIMKDERTPGVFCYFDLCACV